MTTCDDIVYIERTLAGDTAAFSVLVERYRSMIFSMVVKVVRHRQDAEDVAQDIFVKAFSSLKSFRNEARFSTWLCRIAYNAAISHTRKNRTEQSGIEIESDRYPDSDDEYSELHAERISRLQRSLGKLPAEDAILVSLYYQHDKQMEEIASITGLSAANVKVRLHRTRKKLYQEMQNV